MADPLGWLVQQQITSRAQELAREFYACVDPDKALQLIQQLCDETRNWTEKYPLHYLNGIVPAWEAAMDALAAVEKHLKANPDPVRQKVFDIIKETLASPDLQNNQRIILPS